MNATTHKSVPSLVEPDFEEVGEGRDQCPISAFAAMVACNVILFLMLSA